MPAVTEQYKTWIKNKILEIDSTLNVKTVPQTSWQTKPMIVIDVSGYNVAPYSNRQMRVSYTFLVRVGYLVPNLKNFNADEVAFQELVGKIAEKFTNYVNRSPGVTGGDVVEGVSVRMGFSEEGGDARVAEIEITISSLEVGFVV